MPTIDVSPEAILALELPANGSGATTVRGYLIELLRAVTTEQHATYQDSGSDPGIV